MSRRAIGTKLLSVAILLLMLQLTGCMPSPPVPSWLKQKPTSDTKTLYGIGICPRTFNRKDAIEYAFEDAIARLAKRVKVRVKSLYTEIVEGGEARTGKEAEFGISLEVVDLVLYGAEQLNSWYDRDGLVGEPATTYVLIRWTESKFRETVEELMGELSKTSRK